MSPKSPQRHSLNRKIMHLMDAVAQVGTWRAEGERIVFTNGVFDLVHLGHLHYLADAADLGDRLIVGVNADASVRRLKGPERPIFEEETRAFKLASLAVVDAVVVFAEDTPIALIEQILPDVLVKGGDYDPDTIVGADLVRSYQGHVLTIPLTEGHSSTSIIERIKNS